jgi:predicted nucleic acid-binding protein
LSCFADSSALVKLYFEEAGSAEVLSLDGLIVSQLARVEVPAAIWRKQRMGFLGAREAGLLVEEFEADYYGTQTELPRFAAVAASDLVVDTASRLAGVHGLRAYDALQLATAQVARSADPGCRTFVAYDADLCKAAVGEGFGLLPGT